MEPLKAPLKDPRAGSANVEEVRRIEAFWSLVRRMEGGPLVDEYLQWRARHPHLTLAMVRAIAVRVQAERRALEALWTAAEARS